MTSDPSQPPYLRWCEHFSVGVPALDRDHKALVELINRACAAWAEKAEDSLGQLLEELLELAAVHFEREEAVLRGVPGYRALEAHGGEHRNRLAQLQRIVAGLADDGSETALPEALVDWFIKQSVGHDAAIKAYFDDGRLRYATS